MIDHRVDDFQPGVQLVIGFDEDPRRSLRARVLHNILRIHFIRIPLLAVAPVFFGQLPVLVLRFLAFLEARKLLILADVQPEFQKQDAAINDLVLIVVNLVIRTSPLIFGGKSLCALHQYAAVPTAIEHGDIAGARQFSPEAPQVMVGPLLVGRCRKLVHACLARVETPDRASNSAAFATGVGAFEHQYR